jgi:hypothetical protein
MTYTVLKSDMGSLILLSTYHLHSPTSEPLLPTDQPLLLPSSIPLSLSNIHPAVAHVGKLLFAVLREVSILHRLVPIRKNGQITNQNESLYTNLLLQISHSVYLSEHQVLYQLCKWQPD